jgi:hypothetical protein
MISKSFKLTIIQGNIPYIDVVHPDMLQNFGVIVQK